MRKRVLLQTAVLLAATVNFSYVAASCVPPAKGQTPLDVLKCIQSELDSQQKRIAELEKENQRLRQKTDTFTVSGDGNVAIGTTSPNSLLKLHVQGWVGVGNVVGSNGITFEPQSGFHRIAFSNLRFYDWQGGGDMVTFNDTNVGIGTTSPHYKLDVNGTIRGHNVSPSDQRYKQNIQTLENALTKLQVLRGVSFEWKGQNADIQIGLIAQEVEKVWPELVSTDSEGYKSIAYGQLTAILIEAVKEQQQNIDQKSATIASQQLSLQEQQENQAAQAERMASLEAMMQEMARQVADMKREMVAQPVVQTLHSVSP
jgi:hypothetical protein